MKDVTNTAIGKDGQAASYEVIGWHNAFAHKIVLSPLFQEMIFQSTTGSGREGLPKYNLEQFIVPLPPLAEQQAIDEKIDRLIAITNELEKQVTERKGQAEMLMQSVLREAFAG